MNPGSSLRIERLCAGPIPRERTGDLVSGVSNVSGGWESDERPGGGAGRERGISRVPNEAILRRYSEVSVFSAYVDPPRTCAPR